jgi:hypothetical protein
MAAGAFVGAHAERPPPTAVHGPADNCNHGHLAAARRHYRNQGIAQAVHAAGEVFLAAQMPIIERDGGAGHIGIPDAEQCTARCKRLTMRALLRAPEHMDQKQRVDVALENPPDAQIASPDVGKYAKKPGRFVQPQWRSADQSEVPQAVESCGPEMPRRGPAPRLLRPRSPSAPRS